MKALGPLSARYELLVDNLGRRVVEPLGMSVVGLPGAFTGSERLLYALATNLAGGNISLRYHPPKDESEQSVFGMSFEHVIAKGSGIASGELQIDSNTVPPVEDTTDWVIGPVSIRGRALYATLSGGKVGSDYQLIWTATDSDGNAWVRTALCLVAQTS